MPPELRKVQPAPISVIKWSNQPRKSVSEVTSNHVIKACYMFILVIMKDHLPTLLGNLYTSNLLTESKPVANGFILQSGSPDTISSDSRERKEKRAGKIKTLVSNMKWPHYSINQAVCHTIPSLPSISLITFICYPELAKFKTSATIWGCKHEATAHIAYFEKLQKSHNFCLAECGLFLLGNKHPFIGASPDGITNCACCDEGIVEGKVCSTFMFSCTRHACMCLISDYVLVPPQSISDVGDSGAEMLQPTPAVQSDIVNYCAHVMHACA